MKKILIWTLAIFLITLWSNCKKEQLHTNRLANPQAVFTLSSMDCEAPCSITFNASGSKNAERFQWDYESDGTIDAEGVEATGQFNTPGDYLVTLTVINGNLTDSNSMNYKIRTPMIDPPVPSFSISNPNCNAPCEILFNAASSTNYEELEWDFQSDGTIDATGVTTSFIYNRAGTYNVTLYARNSGGEVSTSSFIEIESPKFSITLGEAQVNPFIKLAYLNDEYYILQSTKINEENLRSSLSSVAKISLDGTIKSNSLSGIFLHLLDIATFPSSNLLMECGVGIPQFGEGFYPFISDEFIDLEGFGYASNILKLEDGETGIVTGVINNRPFGFNSNLDWVLDYPEEGKFIQVTISEIANIVTALFAPDDIFSNYSLVDIDVISGEYSNIRDFFGFDVVSMVKHTTNNTFLVGRLLETCTPTCITIYSVISEVASDGSSLNSFPFEFPPGFKLTTIETSSNGDYLLCGSSTEGGMNERMVFKVYDKNFTEKINRVFIDKIGETQHAIKAPDGGYLLGGILHNSDGSRQYHVIKTDKEGNIN